MYTHSHTHSHTHTHSLTHSFTHTHILVDIIKMYNPNVRGFATKYTIPFTKIGSSKAKNDVARSGGVAE